MQTLVTVYDSVIQAHISPRFYRNKAEAIRAFADAVSKDQHLSDHGADYTLMEVGEFNDETGQLIPSKVPLSLGSAASYINRDSIKPS